MESIIKDVNYNKDVKYKESIFFILSGPDLSIDLIDN